VKKLVVQMLDVRHAVKILHEGSKATERAAHVQQRGRQEGKKVLIDSCHGRALRPEAQKQNFIPAKCPLQVRLSAATCGPRPTSRKVAFAA
jgi:hypothetical protein